MVHTFWRMVFTNLMTVSVGFLTLVLLAIVAAGVFSATLRTTLERIREISVLKTVGMTSRRIALMAVGSTLVLSVLASGPACRSASGSKG